MTNGELRNVTHALGKLAEVRLPMRTGLQIRSMMRTLNQVGEDIEAERQKLVEQLAEKDADGKPLVADGMYVFGDRLAEFEAGFAELMACEVSGLPAPLTGSQLGDASIEPHVLLQLGGLLAD